MALADARAEVAAVEAVKRSKVVDEALRYFAFLMFSVLQLLSKTTSSTL